MRSTIGRELRKEFAERLSEVSPDFKRCKTNVLVKGDLAFERKVGTGLSLYVALLTCDNQDMFSIEIAWSEKRRFPNVFQSRLSEGPRKGELRCRLCKLWSKEDVWWRLEPEESLEEMVEKMDQGRFFEEFPLDQAMANIKPQLEDAIAKLRKYGMPYFAKVIEEHGYQADGA